ncbi:Glycoside hydrolase superfamily [Sesbania bispinosa]|nr:Glycoside hydrolase superfamily [Sesbania bispinosa]
MKEIIMLIGQVMFGISRLRVLGLFKNLGRLGKEPGFDWGDDCHPNLSMEKLVVYRLNVKCFTEQESNQLPSDLAGTFSGLAKKVQHFKDLEMVKTMHDNGIEVLMEVVFSNTGDIGALQGIDDLSYYYANGVGDLKNVGLSLVDLVSFSNEDLAVELSWNCGEEGPTNNTTVLERRLKQIHIFLFILFVSLGVPVLNIGDECGQSSGGSPAYGNIKPFN